MSFKIFVFGQAYKRSPIQCWFPLKASLDTSMGKMEKMTKPILNFIDFCVARPLEIKNDIPIGRDYPDMSEDTYDHIWVCSKWLNTSLRYLPAFQSIPILNNFSIHFHTHNRWSSMPLVFIQVSFMSWINKQIKVIT